MNRHKFGVRSFDFNVQVRVRLDSEWMRVHSSPGTLDIRLIRQNNAVAQRVFNADSARRALFIYAVAV